MTDALRKGEVRCPPELLDVMEIEEQWLAAHADRTPRTRDELAVLIDTSVYEEALALRAGT